MSPTAKNAVREDPTVKIDSHAETKMGTNDDEHGRFRLGPFRHEIARTENVVDVTPEFTVVRNRSSDGVLWVEIDIERGGIERG